MKIKEIAERLNLAVMAGSEGLDREVSGGYTSDLLSDVMGNAAEGAIWITLQTHKNVMAIASLRDLAGIILVKGNKPDPDTAIQAETESIPVLGTDLSAFEISGKLYQLIF
jgi:serine kinase of HPr protein (carbohydrate metabolism regulator)